MKKECNLLCWRGRKTLHSIYLFTYRIPLRWWYPLILTNNKYQCTIYREKKREKKRDSRAKHKCMLVYCSYKGSSNRRKTKNEIFYKIQQILDMKSRIVRLSFFFTLCERKSNKREQYLESRAHTKLKWWWLCLQKKKTIKNIHKTI